MKHWWLSLSSTIANSHSLTTHISHVKYRTGFLTLYASVCIISLCSVETVYSCVSLCFTVSLCVVLHLSVYSRVSLCFPVSLCVFLCLSVYSCISLCIPASLCELFLDLDSSSSVFFSSCWQYRQTQLFPALCYFVKNYFYRRMVVRKTSYPLVLL